MSRARDPVTPPNGRAGRGASCGRGATLALAAGLALLAGCAIARRSATSQGSTPSGTGTGNPIRVLLTNDDGIRAPGINALRRSLAAQPERFDVVVIAPASDRSGSGMSRSHGSIQVARQGPRAYAVYGTPADCVYAGVSALMTPPPQLVVSGMNAGENIGATALSSGTVGAAMTSALLGFPAIAVSVDTDGRYASQGSRLLDDAARFTTSLIERAVASPDTLPSGTILSVNYPALARDDIRGVRILPQAPRLPKRRRYEIISSGRSSARARRLILARRRSERPIEPESEDTDIGAFENGWITITPLTGNWTSQRHLDRLPHLLRGLPGLADTRAPAAAAPTGR